MAERDSNVGKHASWVEIEFRILGPIEALAAGTPIDLFGPRQERLLAALLLDAGRTVPVSHIIDAIWDNDPPPTARRQVQDLVSRLRRTFTSAGAAPTTIATTAGGYTLYLDGHVLDASRFHALTVAARDVAVADPANAAAGLRSALGLWRGPALAELNGATLRAAATALDESRLTAWEQCLDLELRLGRHHQVAAEVAALATNHPYRESLVGLLMVALVRSGRRADALDTYQRLRRRLVDGLGVDPHAELQALHRLILQGDLDQTSSVPPQAPRPPRAPAAPAVPALVVPAQLPLDVRGFTGRDSQLSQLDTLLGAAAEQPTAVVVAVLTGTAGVGKTALAVHWAHRVAARFADGQLYINLRGYAPGLPLRPIEALARFLHAMGVPPEQVPVEVEEAASMYRSLLAGRRMLVVLDNARDSDQVRPLLPGSPGSVVLITSRERLLGLVARDGADSLALDVLTPVEADALLGRLLGSRRLAAEPAAAAELAGLCAYLPLALRIVAANCTAHGDPTLASYTARLRSGNRLHALRVDGDDKTAVADAFDLSYTTQPPGGRRLFRLLGLAPGPDITTDAAVALAGVAPEEASRLLNRLAAAHLVEEYVPDRYTMHDLLRLYAGGLSAVHDAELDRQAALHRLFDYYLRAVDAAAQLLYRQMVRLPLPAAVGEAPLRIFTTPSDASTWLDAERANLVAVVGHAAAYGPGSVAWLLADALRGYFHLRMYTVDWLTVANAGLAAACAGGDLPAQAAAELSIAVLDMRQGRYRSAIDHASKAQALARQGAWPEGEAAATGNLGVMYRLSGQLAQAADHHAQSLALSRRTSRLSGQAVSLGNLASVYWELGRLEQAADHHTRALALNRELGSRDGEATELGNLGEVQYALGYFDRALDYLAEALALQREIGQRAGEVDTLCLTAAVHRDAGRLAEALELAHAALALARETGEHRFVADALNTLATIHLLGNHPAQAIDYHRQVRDLIRSSHSRYPEAQALIGLAAAHADLGRYDQARAYARQAVALSRRMGYRMLEGQAMTGLTAIALHEGRYDEAVRQAAEALAVHRETGHRLGQARSLLLLGHARRHTDSVESAVAHWREAGALFADIGAREAALVHRLLRHDHSHQP